MSVGYAYLDQNVVDRIDTRLRTALVSFLQDNGLTPVVSTASLGEIERGERPERVAANIDGLLDLGARFIIEADSRILIVTLSSGRISELLASKNQLVEDTVNVVNAAQFYLICCTSKGELEKRIDDVAKQISVLIDRYDSTNAKASRNLQELIDLMEAIKTGGVPPQYNWAGDLRSSLAMDPREINNLTPKDLWRIINEATRASGASLPFDISRGSTRERIYNVLLTLHAIGFWADGVGSRKSQLAFNYDCMHGIYGVLCSAVISADKRFMKRLRAAYYYLGIPTRTVLLAGGQFTEYTD